MNYKDDDGIWFEEEDPTSEYYKPECCRNVYVDLASGVYDKAISYKYNKKVYIYYCDEEIIFNNKLIDFDAIMNKWLEYEIEDDVVDDKSYDADDEFVEIDLN